MAGAAAHGGDGGVGHVHAGVGGFQHGGGVDAAGVVGVKVDGDFDFFAQGFYQFEGGVRFAEAGHVFDGKKMCAEFFELLGHCDVILQGVFGPRFVEHVAGVADSRLADGAGFESGVDGNAHIVDGIEGIEDAEDVDALGVGFADEFFYYVVWIRRVAYCVCATKEHLEANVGDALAELAETLPGVFVEETKRGVEGCATPHFEAEEIG